MGAAAVPIAFAVASAAATAYNTNRTAKKQDADTAEGIRKQSEEQRKATARLNETLSFFEDSSSGDIRDKLSNRYKKQIIINEQKALAGLDSGGGSSDAFKDSAMSGGGEVSNRADILQSLFARIDAPVDQRTKEGFERGDLGSDLSVFSRNSAAEDYLTKLRVSGIRRSPWLDILAAGLSGASKGTSGGFGGGGGTGATIAGSGGQSPQTFFNSTSAATLPGMFNAPQKKTGPGLIFGP